MFDEKTLQIRNISGHSGGVPGKGAQRVVEVCKLMDTTTCIGCKACEVACVEWNDMPFEQTVFENNYQTMPDTKWNFWQLMKFNEVHRGDDGSLSEFPAGENDGTLSWIFRKHQCMHCADPGCLRACPADGAIVQYENGIVDFQQENCIGCEFCVSGCPFNIPKFNQTTRKVYKCTLCSDRVGAGLEPACIKACPTGCLQFGTKDDMVALGNLRVSQLKKDGFKDAVLYDPQGVGGTSVVTVLKHNRPDWYDLPADPHVPILVRVWKQILRPIGVIAAAFAVIGVFGHYTNYGPKEVPVRDDERSEP